MILVSFPSLAAFGSSAADGAGRVPAGSPAGRAQAVTELGAV